MFGEEDDIECDYDDDYLMLTAPSNLMAEQPRVQETGRVSTILFPQVFSLKCNFKSRCDFYFPVLSVLNLFIKAPTLVHAMKLNIKEDFQLQKGFLNPIHI